MKRVGRAVFNINCLYVAKMRGEEDSEGVMAREVRDVGWETGSVCACACWSLQRAAALISHDGTSEAFL